MDFEEDFEIIFDSKKTYEDLESGLIERIKQNLKEEEKNLENENQLEKKLIKRIKQTDIKIDINDNLRENNLRENNLRENNLRENNLRENNLRENNLENDLCNFILFPCLLYFCAYGLVCYLIIT